ncbi:MAG: hypothetical protein FD165_2829, partial [Gammaproteobacteria bacterium]
DPRDGLKEAAPRSRLRSVIDMLGSITINIIDNNTLSLRQLRGSLPRTFGGAQQGAAQMSILTPPATLTGASGAILDAEPLAPTIGGGFIGTGPRYPAGASIREVPAGIVQGTTTMQGSDGAGPVAAVQAAPTLSITSFDVDTGVSKHDGLTNDANVFLSGTISPGQPDSALLLLVYSGDTQVGTAVVYPNSQTWTSYDTMLIEGVNNLTVRLADRPSTSNVFAVTLDTKPPVLTVTDIVTETAATVSVFGTVDGVAAGTQIQLRLENGTSFATTAGPDGTWSFIGLLRSAIIDSFTVAATDAAGNSGSAQYVFKAASGGFTYDQYVFGTASDVRVYGEQRVYVGGQALDTDVSETGTQIIWGSASNTTLGGTQFVWGTAIDTSVERQLWSNVTPIQYVGAGGYAFSTTIRFGEQIVYAGGFASGTSIISGSQTVYGAASDVYIYGAGAQYLYGTAAHTTISGAGRQTVYANATATGTTLYAGATQIDWGTAVDTLIAGGSQYVWGTATTTTINTGAQYVGAGATANGTIINGAGEQVVYDGGIAIGALIVGGEQVVYGSAEQATVGNGGLQSVYGSATGTIVNNGGEQSIHAGGTSTGATLSFGAVQIDWGMAIGTTISGGSQYVWGTATGTTI